MRRLLYHVLNNVRGDWFSGLAPMLHPLNFSILFVIDAGICEELAGLYVKALEAHSYQQPIFQTFCHPIRLFLYCLPVVMESVTTVRAPIEYVRSYLLAIALEVFVRVQQHALT